MAIRLPVPETVESALPEYEPEKYWAVWQLPESRYAYMIGFRRDAWLIVLENEAMGQAYLLDDARSNGRSSSQYRLDRLTLPDAFAAARAQPVPFASSIGTTVRAVRGVEILAVSPSGPRSLRRIPL